ncbi:MAG TPA: 3-isopropylmalate dehydratase, partial [Methanospirillum hungatei]|nr:3-isopropylmalate dehydratase [Methanospirillum hungatei]
ASEISETDQVVPHLNEGYLDVSGKKLPTEPVPEFLRRIIDAGGLVAYAKTIRSEDLCIK